MRSGAFSEAEGPREASVLPTQGHVCLLQFPVEGALRGPEQSGSLREGESGREARGPVRC